MAGKQNHLVYETRVNGKRYVGYTEAKRGESGRAAVNDRLREHAGDKRSSLGPEIKGDLDKAAKNTAIRGFKSKGAARDAERERIKDIPPSKRLNKRG